MALDTVRTRQEWDLLQRREYYLEDRVEIRPTTDSNSTFSASTRQEKSREQFYQPVDMFVGDDSLFQTQAEAEGSILRDMTGVNRTRKMAPQNRKFNEAFRSLESQYPTVQIIEAKTAVVEQNSFDRAMELFKFSLMPYVPSLAA